MDEKNSFKCFKTNSFKYLKQQIFSLREKDSFNYLLDLLFTGTSIGVGLYLLKTDYSLLKGLGIAIIIAIIQEYIKWFKDLVIDVKKVKIK